MAGEGWENAVVFAHGSGDTHQLNPLTAAILEHLVEGAAAEHDLLTRIEADFSSDAPAELPSLLERSLRELQRIGLVRYRRT